MFHEFLRFCVFVALKLCGLKLRPILLLMTVPAELLFPLVLVHLLFALLMCPGHDSLRS